MRPSIGTSSGSGPGRLAANVERRAPDLRLAQRVLLIDDDAALTRLVSEYLAGAGFAVEAAGDAATGLAALRRAERGGRPFDLLILDLMLPDADGLELCR